MEHIEDEKSAVLEMLRCLKEDGTIILSFPICPEIDTLEDERYSTSALKKKYYGQEDHVRLYGRDYKERLEQYGLQIAIVSPEKMLEKKMIEENKFLFDDIILLCKKKKTTAD